MSVHVRVRGRIRPVRLVGQTPATREIEGEQVVGVPERRERLIVVVDVRHEVCAHEQRAVQANVHQRQDAEKPPVLIATRSGGLGSSGLSRVIAEATGSSDSGDLGLLLPLLILAAVVGSAAYFWRHRHRAA